MNELEAFLSGKPLIYGADGKPAQSEKYAPCPKCGAGPNVRVPSGGFGAIHPVCPCGHEFEDLKWENNAT